MKILHFLRHGQASHNVRAEGLRAAGCSFPNFLKAMKEDDEFDANLTPAGKRSAQEIGEALQSKLNGVDLAVSSPHSRSIDTADFVLPLSIKRRVIREEWREISGLLQNARRLPRSELQKKYGHWDASEIPHEFDTLWGPDELEEKVNCAERGYQGLMYIWEKSQCEEVVISAHGGIFHYIFNMHPNIIADDALKARFHNCELRTCKMTAVGGKATGITFYLERAE